MRAARLEREEVSKLWLPLKTVQQTDLRCMGMLRAASKMGAFTLLAVLRHLRKTTGKLLQAAHARELWRVNETVQRGHIIAAYVADWWNIRTRSAGGDWPSYLVCYWYAFRQDKIFAEN